MRCWDVTPLLINPSFTFRFYFQNKQDAGNDATTARRNVKEHKPLDLFRIDMYLNVDMSLLLNSYQIYSRVAIDEMTANCRRFSCSFRSNV